MARLAVDGGDASVPLRVLPPVVVIALATVLACGLRSVATGAMALTLALYAWRRSTRPDERATHRDGRIASPSAATMATATLEVETAWTLDVTSDALVLTDHDGRIRHASARARALFGAGASSGATVLAGGFASALADAGEFSRVLEQLYDHAADGSACASGEVSGIHEGRVAVYEWTSEPVRGADGAVVGRGFVFRDRTQERELATLKREFLSTVTHELRTPLTSVKGSLQLVLGKASALSAIERELLAISLKNTDRLIRLINDILDISQLELGKMELSFAPVAAGPLVEEAIAGLRAYAAGRDIAIGCEVDPELPAIAGDRDRLIQVLTNLLSNAVKFSPTGGRVLVTVASSAGELRIAVRDWGVGIRASDHERLFQRFQRLNPGRSDEPGTGLGLAISKAIVDRHGGRIVVESEEAAGSTFTVVLPLADAAVGSATDPATRAALAPSRPTLLLIDDDADFGTVLEVSLGASYRLLRVERGVQALDVARAERPDLVLLDVVLPDLSGYDVLRILQHSEATRDIPVVVLTVQPERTLARGLGAADVVAKPIDVDELRRVIERTLESISVGGGALRVALGPLTSRSPAALIAALEAGGHAVFTASDAWDLVRCADEHAADVAVIESETSSPDGTVAFLRGHVATRRLPLVLLTTHVDGAVASGCTAVDPSVVETELVRVIEDAAVRLSARPAIQVA